MLPTERKAGSDGVKNGTWIVFAFCARQIIISNMRRVRTSHLYQSISYMTSATFRLWKIFGILGYFQSLHLQVNTYALADISATNAVEKKLSQCGDAIEDVRQNAYRGGVLDWKTMEHAQWRENIKHTYEYSFKN